MTTGVSGSPAIPTYDSSTAGTWRYREWSGDNGKYTGGVTFPVKWNNYTCYQDSETVSRTYHRFVCTRPGGGGSGSLILPSQDPYRRFPSEDESSVTGSDINKALNRLLSQVKGHSFQLGVELGQAKQTVNLVVDNLGKLGRSMLALRRGDFSAAARQLGATPRTSQLKAKDISGRWLELQYGWLPLLSSVHEASKAYESISNGPRSATFRSSVARKSVHTYLDSGGVKASQPFTDRRSYTFEMSEELSLQRQLGLTNPLSVAWELIPYSFVVDWFVPIGTYLDNLNQIPKLKGRWLVSRKLGTSGKYDWQWSGPYPLCGYHGYSHRYDLMTHKPVISRDGAYISRVVTFTPPSVPLPSFQPLSGALSPRRIWNAISLAHQRFTS